MRRKKVINLLLLFLYGISVRGQDNTNIFFTGIQSHYGFIITHTSKVEHISHTNPCGIELNFSWLHTSFESWKVFRAYNISGVQLAYYNYRNPDIVGSSYVLSAFTEPILKRSDRFIFSLRGGGGLSYQTKIFDWETNTSNIFFSTRISFPVYVSARIKYGISDNIFLTLSGNYNHIPTEL